MISLKMVPRNGRGVDLGCGEERQTTAGSASCGQPELTFNVSRVGAIVPNLSRATQSPDHPDMRILAKATSAARIRAGSILGLPTVDHILVMERAIVIEVCYAVPRCALVVVAIPPSAADGAIAAKRDVVVRHLIDEVFMAGEAEFDIRMFGK